jgi:hypothetical protein
MILRVKRAKKNNRPRQKGVTITTNDFSILISSLQNPLIPLKLQKIGGRKTNSGAGSLRTLI